MNPTEAKSHLVLDALVSGGVDTILSVLTEPSTRFPIIQNQPTRFSPLPSSPSISVCKARKLMMSHKGNQIDIWKLGSAIADGSRSSGYVSIGGSTSNRIA